MCCSSPKKRMRRGPYKPYLLSTSDNVEVPRSTLYDRKKKETELKGFIIRNNSDYSEFHGQNWEVENATKTSDYWLQNESLESSDEESVGDNNTGSTGSKKYSSENTDDESPQTINENSFESSKNKIVQSSSFSENDTDIEISALTEESFEMDKEYGTTERISFREMEDETYSLFEDGLKDASTPLHHSEALKSSDYNFNDKETYICDQPTNKFYDPYLNEPLCPCTMTTRGETIMSVMTLGVRHNFTWVGIVDTMKTINVLLGQNVLPATKYKLFQNFSVSKDLFTFHILCPYCDNDLGKESYLSGGHKLKTCSSCGKEVNMTEVDSFFLTVNFHTQLQALLKRPDIVCLLDYKSTQPADPGGNLRDIYDGLVYKKLSVEGQPLSEKYNLSFNFATDGCQSGKSASTVLWPIYAAINELPPDLRNKHMIFVGIWACKRKPNMATFLQPFVDTANELSSTGVTWKLHGNGTVTSRVIPMCSCVDSVARSAMLNMKQYNGYYGCTICEHPGERIAGNNTIKFTVSPNVPPLRTHDSILHNIELAYTKSCEENKRKHVKGVWGPTPLMNLEYHDLANNNPADDMHLITGVIKLHTKIIKTDCGKDYYVGSSNTMRIINNRLTSIKTPKCITRTLRSLDDSAQWKASEWRSWLLFYCLVCLNGLLPKKYLTHLAMLVTAINILMGESISRKKLEYAEKLLIKYVVLFQKYFFKKSMTYNVHLLLHLPKSVENFGPLWTHNAYPFEDANRIILKLKQSPTHLALQIARKFIMFQSIPDFSEKFKVSYRIKEFCKELSENRVKFSSKTEDCTLIGWGKPYNLNEEEEACLGFTIENCRVYDRFICNGFKFANTQYTRCNKTDNTKVITKTGVFGIITNICYFSNMEEKPEVIIFFREIELQDNPYFSTSDVSVSHIKECLTIHTGPLKQYSPRSLLSPYILMKINDTYFTSKIPKGCLGD